MGLLEEQQVTLCQTRPFLSVLASPYGHCVSDTTASPKKAQKHPASFAHASVHFVLTTHTAGATDVAKASRRLLAEDIAVSAAWPSERRIHVSERFRKIGHDLQRARSLHRRFDKLLATRTWRAAAVASLMHPTFAPQAMKVAWARHTEADLRALVEKSTVPALVLFLVKHPIWGALNVLPSIRFTKGKTSNPSGQELLDDWPQRDQYDPNWNDEGMQSLNEAEELVIRQQVISAVERHNDAQLFGGQDWEDDRFVRLALRNSYHDILVPGSKTEVQHVVFEPRLFMHDSGVLQLAIRVDTDGPLTTEEVIDFMRGPAPRIVRSEMAKPLLRGTRWQYGTTTWADELDAGARMALIDHAQPLSMTEILLAHMQCLERTIGRSFGHWVNYPIAIIDAGNCCSPSRWQKAHAEDIQFITRRQSANIPLAPHVEKERDFSATTDHSLFVNLGSASYFQWKGPAPSGIDELNTTLVIEYGLSLYRRLAALEEDVAHMGLGARRLQHQYREAVRTFSELRQGNVRAGDARMIIRHLLLDLGADQIRATIESALSLTSTAHATRSAAKASRRSWWLAFIATVFAVLVSVPSTNDLLQAIAKAPSVDDSEWVLGPLREIASTGIWGAWFTVGIVMGVLSLLWVVAFLFRHRPQKLNLARRGYAWPTPIEVSSREDDDQEPHELFSGDSDGGTRHTVQSTNTAPV